MKQPEGFEIYDRKCHVCRLKKALYGLKQAPRAWYERIDSYLMKLGFTRSEADPNLYFKVEYDKPIILVLYVDDLFLIGADPLIHKCKRELASKFEMKDQGLEVWQKPGETFLSQGKYVVKILERFGMVECKPVTTPMELDFKKLSSSATGPVL
ncbi:reverse transcriptase domain-containing protein [Actinobacillus pleuropneumoniae]|uniref:Reverse transcriptase domain-containing protein n=1 Tax=Actinobacillus pleuropneumoniae TaxID=715 RepID=A0A9Q4DKM6_ACTPL|nr:reverse transcriptase domain-containing protein [Actinobacillus pleuropneumoniae]MCY6524885.1 reverse transcriptase domain-containing protein [Actinobacillus pleuropneumoniae]